MLKMGEARIAVGCIVALMTAACSSESGNSATETADNAIMLECDGQSTVGDKKEPVSYLLKIHPGNQFQTSLHFYSDQEKRFVSPCQDKGFECTLNVGDDLITEVGQLMNNGAVSIQKTTEINRRTGTMRVEVYSGPNLPQMTLFEGTCQKGVMPPEEASKF